MSRTSDLGDPSTTEEEIVSSRDILESLHNEQILVEAGLEDCETCSFIKGYVKRQAVYTCQTCLDVSQTQIGFCYPCAVSCHADHDLLELYTKRNFRCDCGNAKFPEGFKCQLWEEKDDVNEDNKYNDSFSNRYCFCHRPYPDPEYEGTEEMFQCITCENWFHIEDDEELVCCQCIKQLPFIAVYKSALESRKQKDEPECKRVRLEQETDRCLLKQALDTVESSGHPSSDDSSITTLDLCRKQLNASSEVNSLAWPVDWRTKVLCRCSDCKNMYAQLRVEFLTDPEDSLLHYVSVSEKKIEQQQQDDSQAISSLLAELPHASASLFAEGVGRMKTALTEFIEKKGSSGEVITADEIRSLFERLEQNKPGQYF